MNLDTRPREGKATVDRERYLLRVIRYLDDQDCWFLDEAPEMVAVLRRDFGFHRDNEDVR